MNDMKAGAQMTSAYDTDFYAWTQDQAARLRAQKPANLDWQHIAQHVEELGKAELTTIEEDLVVILTQLLKVRHLHERATLGWRTSINQGRHRIADIGRRSPSLRQRPEEILPFKYTIARERAAHDAGLLTDKLPATCPFSIRQILDQDFWPQPVEE
jgi:hypothetical protein